MSQTKQNPYVTKKNLGPPPPKPKVITIKFQEDHVGWVMEIKENGKRLRNVKSLLLIALPYKSPIYVKNIPDAWLEKLIEKGEILTFKPTNPSKRTN